MDFLRAIDPAWLAVGALALILLVLLWLGWDGYRQTRRIVALEAAIQKLDARQDRLQARLPPPTGKHWGDDDRLTAYNWRKPEPF